MIYGLKDVSIKRGGAWVLRDFSLDLPQRGVLCLLGPSGCGKTTILHLLAGLLRPEKGSVSAPPHGKIGIVFQEDRLLPWLSAKANVELIPGAHGVMEMLERLEMGDLGERPAARMSGGQKRRVALARALAAPSDLLLLDEPFKGIDVKAREKAMEVVAHGCALRPCLLVTHDEAEAGYLAGEIVRMPVRKESSGIKK